jgi:hypothetical protein
MQRVWAGTVRVGAPGGMLGSSTVVVGSPGLMVLLQKGQTAMMWSIAVTTVGARWP